VFFPFNYLQLNKNTTIGTFKQTNSCQALGIHLTETIDLTLEKDFKPIRIHKMTEDAFNKLDINKDIPSQYHRELKSLIMQYRDVLFYSSEDQGR
jgi:hypothetical protein